MTYIVTKLKQAVLSFLIFSTVGVMAIPTHMRAAGPTTATGPQGSVGVQGDTGPQGDVGPTTQVTTTNTDTGADSINSSAVDSTSSTTVVQNNTADITNQVTAVGNTGGVEVTGNTSVGQVTTGDINASINIINASNSTFGDGSSVGVQTVNGADGSFVYAPSDTRASLNNFETGSGSTNTQTLNSTNVVTGTLSNDASINNTVAVVGNTGSVALDSNTRVDGLRTGNVNVQANFLNLANLSMADTGLTLDVVDVYNGLNGDIVIDTTNDTTGQGSINTSQTTSNQNTALKVTQAADVDNTIHVVSTTGDNAINGNTEVGDVTTGNTTVSSAVSNVVNQIMSPVVYIFNVFGTWAGNILGLDPNQVIVNVINDTTGAESTNSATTNIDNQASFDVSNAARVSNTLLVDANTGTNTVTNNTSVGAVKTGDVTVAATFTNFLNGWSSNVGHAIVRVFNIFGNWNGNVTTTRALAHNTKPSPEPGVVVNSSENSPAPVHNQTMAWVEPPKSALENDPSRVKVAKSSASYSHKTVKLGVSTSDSTESDGSRTSNVSDTTRWSGLIEPVSAASTSEKVSRSSGFPFGYGVSGLILASWLGVEVMSRRKNK